MPKAATRSKRKLNSDEEDVDFIPKEFAPQKQKEKTAIRKTVRKYSATTREETDAVATEAARNAPSPTPQLRTRDEKMSFLVSTIQGMEKKVSEILLNQKSLERIAETKFQYRDVKIMELTTIIEQIQHEVDSVKIPAPKVMMKILPFLLPLS
ncbi:hypothetical protein D1007_24772 [Hordeum vulgare]|nr:hypothetical protein D1007_31561 [Hordeum vulgare]KAE8799892.1 hypothetical protein D1007_24772 [Hordeum vulgare]